LLQYKIPQNVERDDMILSFLSMKQLGILAIGGFVSYILYNILSIIFFVEIWGPIIFFVNVLTLAFAFLEINKVPFWRWMFLILEFNFVPRKRMWDNRHSSDHEMKALVVNVAKKKEKKKELEEKKVVKTLAELVQEIDMKKAKFREENVLDKEHVDMSYFNEEDRDHLERLEKLSKIQKIAKSKKSQLSSPVKIEKKGEVLSEDMKVKSVQIKVPQKETEDVHVTESPERYHDALHQDFIEKVKSVRPDLEIESIEESTESETDKILKAALEKINREK